MQMFATGSKLTPNLRSGLIHARFRHGADTKLAMSHSKIEIYWKTIETAPHGVIAQVRVTDGCGSDYSLPYPCKLTKDGWVNAASGKPLMVRATYWRAVCRNHAEDEGRDAQPASEGASARAQLISQ